MGMLGDGWHLPQEGFQPIQQVHRIQDHQWSKDKEVEGLQIHDLQVRARVRKAIEGMNRKTLNGMGITINKAQSWGSSGGFCNGEGMTELIKSLAAYTIMEAVAMTMTLIMESLSLEK